MDDDDKARPVSGEIMSGTTARGQRPQPDADVSDAQYETVPPHKGTPAPARYEAGAATTGMEFLKQGAAAPKGTRRGGVLFWGLGLLLVGLAFWISGGHALLTRGGPAPGAAPRTPLSIADVTSRVETRDGRAVLFVDGRASNGGAEARALPPIAIAVTANDGRVTRYRLSTRDTELKPGDRYSFSSRLEAPESGVRTVSVAFEEDER